MIDNNQRGPTACTKGTVFRCPWHVGGDCRRNPKLAAVLAALTGDPVVEWRRRTLVWADACVDDGRDTVYSGRLVRWRIDEPNHPECRDGWYHHDSSSTLLTTDAAEAWALLANVGLEGAMPDYVTTVRDAIREACARGGR